MIPLNLMLYSVLHRFWDKIPLDRRNEFVGLTALAVTEEGCIVNPFLNKADTEVIDVSWNDLVGNYGLLGDMVFCARADILKAHPFPEVDLVIPESVIWTTIGHRPTRFISKVLKTIEYKADHAISFSRKMAYNRGRAHALATSTRNLRHYKRSWRVRTWRLITFLRYCLHGDIPISSALRLWGGNSSFGAFCTAVPIAFVFALKDQMQGKVIKTHHEFIVANPLAHISVKQLSGAGKH